MDPMSDTERRGAMTMLRRSLLFSFMERQAGIVIAIAMAGSHFLAPTDYRFFLVGMSAFILVELLRGADAGTFLVQLETPERSAAGSAVIVSGWVGRWA